MVVNWERCLIEAFNETGDDYSKMETTLSEKELKEMFDNDYGCAEGSPFTAWGDNYVYFPVVYDGAEWVGYAPRNPCDIKTEHLGGG